MPPKKEPDGAENIGLSFSTATIRAVRKSVIEWGKENFQPFPWRDTPNLWHGLIAEILLQRTKANSVTGVFHRFIAVYPTPADLAAASTEEIGEIIYPLGLKWRAPLLKQLGERLEALGGKPPATLAGLLTLPAVGPYAAAAYLSFHAKRRGTIIDANVVRWLCRMVDRPMDGETRREKWLIQLAESLTPKHNTDEYNYAILDFSMKICAKRPKCEQCPIGPKYCDYGRTRLTKRLLDNSFSQEG